MNKLELVENEIKRRTDVLSMGAHSAFRNGKLEALREMREFIDSISKVEESMEVKERDEVISKILDHFNIINPTSSLFENVPKEKFIDIIKSL